MATAGGGACRLSGARQYSSTQHPEPPTPSPFETPVLALFHRPRPSVRLTLSALAAALWVAVAFFVFVVPQTPARLARRTAELSARLPAWEWITGLPLPVPSTPGGVAAGLAVAGGVAFLAYGVALWVAWSRATSTGTTGLAAAAAIILFLTSWLALPTFNTDIFNYMVQGRVAAKHGENPHYTPAAAFPEDPLLPYASTQYTGVPNDYLPAWSLYNVTLARLTDADPVRSLLIYRSGFLALSLINLILIGLILGKIDPAHRLAGIIAYGWNPIVVLEGQSRVDTLMAFYLLLSMLLLTYRRQVAGFVALTLSVFTKWITLPVLILHVAEHGWRSRWKELALGSAAAVLACVLIYLPFFDSSEILTTHLDMLMRGGSSAPESWRLALGAGLVTLAVWLARGTEGAPTRRARAWAIVLLGFVMFLSKIGFAWYLIVPAAAVSLVRDRWILLVFGALAFSAFAFQVRDSAFNRAFPLPELLEVDRFFVFLALAAAVATAGVGVGVVRRRSGGRWNLR